MKNQEHHNVRNKFPAQKLCRDCCIGTPHRNGESPISGKAIRLSRSYVPTLPFTLNKVDIKGFGRAKRPYTRVKGFYGIENKYGRFA